MKTYTEWSPIVSAKAMNMKRYREWSPTSFDAKNLECGVESDWLVSPIGQNRDSDAIERLNFDEQSLSLEACEDGDYQSLEFGHWACGWFAIVLVRPGSKAEAIVNRLIERLENYPILNEDRLYQFESDEDYDV